MKICFAAIKRIIKLKDHQCANGIINPWAVKYNKIVSNVFEIYLKSQGINIQIMIPVHPENNGVYFDNERIFFPIDRYNNKLNKLKFNYKIKEFKMKKYLYLLQDITLWDDTDYR